MSNSEPDIDNLITALTLEEKVSLCHAAGKFQNHGVERLGIPPLVMSDGPHGVRQELHMHGWDPLQTDSDTTTYLPVGTVLAATWNPDVAREFGEVLGSESRARGKDVILAPGINIIRDPLCGRNFEYLSEDPFLITQLAPPLIQGIQSQDTAACVKHFALNNQELNRHGYNAEPDERTLREIYLPGFEAAVKEGGVLTLMGSYNKYKGQWCCHNRELLVDLLKNEWGFEGLVVSDWDGCHVAEEAARNGLDIEMGTSAPSYDDYHLANAFLEGLRAGKYPVALVDDKVRRILHVIQALKVNQSTRKSGRQHPPEHAQTGRCIAEEGVVLLQNDGILPLDLSSIKTIAVIGDNATRLHAQGGGSSGVKPWYEISPLEALRETLGTEVEILHAKGYPEEAQSLPQIPDNYLATVDAGSGIKGWRVEWNNFHQFEGPTLAVEFREGVDLSHPEDSILVPGQRRNWWATRWTARLTPPVTGTYTFALNCDYTARFSVNRERVISVVNNKELELNTGRVDLVAGQAVDLEIVYLHTVGDSLLKFGWFMPGEKVPTANQAKAEALRIAARADVVLFFGGLNHFHDNEGMDRKSYALPGGQEGLIAALLEVNPRVVFTFIGGSAAALPRADRLPAILWGGYAGMDCGRVFADILLGKVNPSGKLPYTVARRLEDFPARALDDVHADTVRYKEGLLVGYRWFDRKGIEPLFPFGHGLSYTRFELSDPVSKTDETGVHLEVTLRNSGEREGREVVQVYVEALDAGEDRPLRELKAFRSVRLDAGASERLSMSIPWTRLARWDACSHAWISGTGPYRLHLGFSSRDLPLLIES
ncbi:MAG: glycoside hydrolase family 3 protein [Kiritimatiellia bacterium]